MTSRQMLTYRPLVKEGYLSEEKLEEAFVSAGERRVEIETVLMDEYGVPKPALLSALAKEFGFPPIEFDERLPVPPRLLEGLEPDRLRREPMFPIILENEKIIAAVNDPGSPEVREEIDRFVQGPYTLRVSLVMEILWYMQDFLNDRPGRIIGTERTGLAFWRNTMAAWRTRMACYRTEMARMRSWQALMRWGLGMVTLAAAFIIFDWKSVLSQFLIWLVAGAGLALAGFGTWKYGRMRRHMIRMPQPQTLAEVTAATTAFLDRYHLDGVPRARTGKTMLSRLSDLLPSYGTILRPSPASRERTHLARERNIMAAQRTIAGCYRTMYARARTGLGFIRTGITFLSIGAGLVKVYELHAAGLWGVLLAVAGALMAADGIVWYYPARKEEPDLGRQLSEPAPGSYAEAAPEPVSSI
ncbi:MAG: type II secretion protein [Actinobacteria bacterium]|nr:type II secretion protein [Actinomycetota bacterium]